MFILCLAVNNLSKGASETCMTSLQQMHSLRRLFPVLDEQEYDSSFWPNFQILDEKFLIAFGPCKHGKYRETTYQDTFVFDIVDYCDAQRHTIITGDHVLAPWESEGERFGPGIVIDGQEKRQAIGKSRDPC